MIIGELANKRKKTLIMSAHQDDAEFSCGRLLLRRRGQNSHVIYFTDGRMGQVHDEKISKDEHANIRKIESIKAMAEFGLSFDNLIFLDLPDQGLISNPYIIDKLYILIKKIKPDYILIPPWEGAHPDHDAVHIFSILGARNSGFNSDKIIEYASYNNYGGKFNVQKFIPNDIIEEVFTPSEIEQKKWKNIMKIFESQPSLHEKYVPNSIDERYRKVPSYDYSSLPYSDKISTIIRGLFDPVYIKMKRKIPDKYKMFYETWDNDVNPNENLKKINNYTKEYSFENEKN